MMTGYQITNNQAKFSNIALPRWFPCLVLGAITLTSTMMPVKAQTLYFSYPPLYESLRVDSLDTFAQDGTINKDLGLFLNLARASEEGKIQFRKALIRVC